MPPFAHMRDSNRLEAFMHTALSHAPLSSHQVPSDYYRLTRPLVITSGQWTFRDCHFINARDTPGDGIVIDGPATVRIIDCSFRDFDQVIRGNAEGAHLHIEGCRFINSNETVDVDRVSMRGGSNENIPCQDLAAGSRPRVRDDDVVVVNWDEATRIYDRPRGGIVLPESGMEPEDL